MHACVTCRQQLNPHDGNGTDCYVASCSATLKARMLMAKIKMMLGGGRRTTTTTATHGNGLGMHHAHGTHAGAKQGCFGFGKRRATGHY